MESLQFMSPRFVSSNDTILCYWLKLIGVYNQSAKTNPIQYNPLGWVLVVRFINLSNPT